VPQTFEAQLVPLLAHSEPQAFLQLEQQTWVQLWAMTPEAVEPLVLLWLERCFLVQQVLKVNP
jgi:hypothetical protein